MIDIVVSADDLGVSHDRNRGIYEATNCGAVTSVSLMVNGVAVKAGVDLFAERLHIIGLHLNLTEGVCISPPNMVRVFSDKFEPSLNFHTHIFLNLGSLFGSK
jgi:predicted glycoside hydrolase/deacetylase ChbG (UPF0249 family)